MPTQNNALVDKFLTNISNKFKPEGFIHEMIFPEIQVNQYSGKVGSYGKRNFRIEHSIAGGKTKYPQITSNTIESDLYNLEAHGLTDMVTREDRANFDSPFNNVEADRTEDITDVLMLGKEKALADSLTSTSVLTNNDTLSGTSQYDHSSGGDPIGDFKTARNTVRANTGALPNMAIMSYSVFEGLRWNPVLIDYVKYSESVIDGLTRQQLAKAMDVEKVAVGTAVYDSAKEGQTPSLANVWNNDLIFARVEPTAKRKGLTLGGRFQKGRARDVYKYPINNPPKATEILVEDIYDFVIFDPALGYLFKDAVSG